MSGSTRYLIAVCYSRGADLTVWRADLTDQQRARLAGALSSLVELGEVATFALGTDLTCSWAQIVSDLGGKVGGLAVESCMTGLASAIPMPAFVMPVWPFDHEVGKAPASTAQFLGLDLELIATPSNDEEWGAYLPGRNGRWLIHARPFSS